MKQYLPLRTVLRNREPPSQVPTTGGVRRAEPVRVVAHRLSHVVAVLLMASTATACGVTQGHSSASASLAVHALQANANASTPTWSVERPRDVRGALISVSCVSQSFCVAVGSDEQSTPHSYVVIWKAGSWDLASLPNLGSSAEWSSVSCGAVGSCLLVGENLGRPSSLLMTAGKWRVAPFPQPVAPSGRLLGVSCISTSWCLAIGEGPGEVPIGYRFQGESWIRTTPLDKSYVSLLRAVSCIGTSRACIAVGLSFKNNPLTLPPSDAGYSLLAERYVKGSWSYVSLPAQAGSLFDIGCYGTGCLAVGGVASQGDNSQPALLEIDQGWSWLAPPAVLPGPITAVSCANKEQCIALSQKSHSVGSVSALLLNGAWHTVRVPNLSPPIVLRSLSCGVLATTCVAVGYQDSKDPAPVILSLRLQVPS